MTILYPVKSGLYVNLTNRCPCACSFCIRKNGDGAYGSDSLWLEREPSFDEIKAAFASVDLSRFSEVVFCGYGEPTERLDVLLETARFVRALRPGLRIRVNTNGLSDLINGRPTASDFAGLVDEISVSLNAASAEEYVALCRPKFGLAAYDALLAFAGAAKRHVPSVVMTVVRTDALTAEKESACRAVCARLGVVLRVREYVS